MISSFSSWIIPGLLKVFFKCHKKKRIPTISNHIIVGANLHCHFKRYTTTEVYMQNSHCLVGCIVNHLVGITYLSAICSHKKVRYYLATVNAIHNKYRVCQIPFIFLKTFKKNYWIFSQIPFFIRKYNPSG